MKDATCLRIRLGTGTSNSIDSVGRDSVDSFDSNLDVQRESRQDKRDKLGLVDIDQ